MLLALSNYHQQYLFRSWLRAQMLKKTAVKNLTSLALENKQNQWLSGKYIFRHGYHGGGFDGVNCN